MKVAGHHRGCDFSSEVAERRQNEGMLYSAPIIIKLTDQAGAEDRRTFLSHHPKGQTTFVGVLTCRGLSNPELTEHVTARARERINALLIGWIRLTDEEAAATE